MEADLIAARTAVYAQLTQYGMLSASGADARGFLHAQLSSDIEHLPQTAARRAGYCSAKGRLLASFLVVPHEGGFLLQLSADLAAPIAKRLTMFVLRSKVSIADASESWAQFGVWGEGAAARLLEAGLPVPDGLMQVSATPGCLVVSIGPNRFLAICSAAAAQGFAGLAGRVAPHWWSLDEVRAGVPLISAPIQDLFVPQMANFELIGGVDFKKGCYPGQEIVARSQYLGKLKRRMYRGEIDAGDSPAEPPVAGAEIFGGDSQPAGTLVSAAPRPDGGYEILAVMQSAQVDQGAVLRLGSAQGAPVRIVPLPYPV